MKQRLSFGHATDEEYLARYYNPVFNMTARCRLTEDYKGRYPELEPGWRVYMPKGLTGPDYGGSVFVTIKQDLRKTPHRVVMRKLHLATSRRSIRSERVSKFVNELLSCGNTYDDINNLQVSLKKIIAGGYDLAITRDLNKAREWVWTHQDPDAKERSGLLATQYAKRLIAEGVDPKGVNDFTDAGLIHWWLNDFNVLDSSSRLEIAISEFVSQGLEIDWAIVGWDGDYRRENGMWVTYNIPQRNPKNWQRTTNTDKLRFQKNAYRVQLTRARKGIVIYIPKGDSRDISRDPKVYDETYDFLVGLGLTIVP